MISSRFRFSPVPAAAGLFGARVLRFSELAVIELSDELLDTRVIRHAQRRQPLFQESQAVPRPTRQGPERAMSFAGVETGKVVPKLVQLLYGNLRQSAGGG